MGTKNALTTNEWFTVTNILAAGSDLAAMYQGDDTKDEKVSNLRGIIDSALIILESKKEGTLNLLQENDQSDGFH